MSTAARIDELLSKFDENPRRYFAPLANEYRKSGELALAISLCREHLPKQPGHMSGHIVFGQALYENGDLPEAQSVFEAALTLDPENLIALRHLGDIARARGDATSARRWYGRVLEADPRNDDIAGLLETLSQRQTPLSVSAVPEAPTKAEPIDASFEDGGFIDEPAWHSPAILGGPMALPEPAAGAAPASTAAAAADDLLDLELPGEQDGAEVPAFFADFAQQQEQQQAEVDDAFGRGESALESPALDPSPSEALTTEASTAEDRRDELPVAFGAADHDSTYDVDFDPSVTDLTDSFLHESEHAAQGALGEPQRATLSDAIDAFESHDPLDSDSDLNLMHRAIGQADESAASALADETAVFATETGASVDAVSASLDAPHADDDEEFAEGLVAIEWPDASLLAERSLSSPRALTPIQSFTPVEQLAIESETVAAEEPDAAFDPNLGEPAFALEADEPHASHESPLELSGREFDAALNDDPDAALQDVLDAALDADLDAELTAELDGELNAELDAALTAELDEELSAEFDSQSDAPFEPASAENAGSRDSADGVHAASVDVAVSDAVDPVDLVEVTSSDTSSSDTSSMGSDGSVIEEPVSLMDEDPPFSTLEIPWLESSEEEREAEPAAEPAEQAELASLPESPAFVTETMAELLVAQGFIARAVGVYEELVRRRPYDEVLSSRLAELQGGLSESTFPAPAAELREEASSASAEPAAAWPSDPSPSAAASGPPLSVTPLSVPSVVETSHSAAQVAPVSRRTAREWLSTVASHRVARRTPAVGTVAVTTMDTPADGLAGLFGAPTMPADDDAARSLATAYGAATPLDTSTPLFASGEFVLPPRESTPTPRNAAGLANAAGASEYSFDRFFPDPATTGSGGSASSERGAATSAPEPARTEHPTSPSADLAQFAHWLKGLSNS